MSINTLENDEEILWQSNIKLYFPIILFLFSSIVLVIGILSNDFFNKFRDYPPGPFGMLLMGLVVLTNIMLLGLPSAGIILAILLWSFAKSEGSISYIATNKSIIDKREKKEYFEYFTFDYSQILKIEIHPRIFFKKRGVSIRIFLIFNSAYNFDWSYKLFKESGMNIPQHRDIEYHVLYNVSNYEPLLEILEQNHVKIIKK
ncbi:MAG: hypothetical protein ACTSR7_12945 [Promethearchaeota archaeon]